ncbi:MAG: O-acetyl-ADP-ribose deacetylase [Proteobacteria bacterium]|nr:O-acetyl-ADP-ribose deacetylase [Pseudomonadota bacterium]
MKIEFGNTEITLEKGDITKHTADAIVNAANSSLLGGGGVDGAIHRVGGPAILEECKQIRARQSSCPPGESVITTGGQLPAERVIHTVGPIWRGGGQNEPKTLANCYVSSLSLAVEYGLKTVAFPSISTGAYGYPVLDAAFVAVRAVREFIESCPGKLSRVTWVLFDNVTFNAFKEALVQKKL